MCYVDDQKPRKPAAKAAPRENQLFEIATLSLLGLTLAVVQITHYVGTDVLRAMFAQ